MAAVATKTEKRLGRQLPTQAVILPYSRTGGEKAVEIYEATGRTAQEWQKQLLHDMLAINDEELWVHTRFGYSLPRRNGKNEVVAAREMYGLIELGERILHTAHRTTTTHTAWERLYDLLAKAIKHYGLKIESSYRAYGKEHIELSNGGIIAFRTRTSKGGLGEGYDLLVNDEAQEYQDDQESALKYVVTDSRNPQTIMTGTPPTPVSSGTIFTNYRAAVLAGGVENAAWAEWSVENQKDPKDKEAWYETNPSLGTILTERAITDEIGSDVIDFNIQRLGLWIRYNQKSAISELEWANLKEKKLPALRGRLYAGIKYSHDGASVSLSIAVRTDDGRVLVEAVDCREVRRGNQWIIDFLAAGGPNIKKIIVDGASGQAVLGEEMKDAKLKRPVLPTVKQIIAANAGFEQAIFQRGLCHMGQPSLAQAVANCEKRAIGSAGGFGYKATVEGIDISLLDSVILAHWGCNEWKETEPGRSRKAIEC